MAETTCLGKPVTIVASLDVTVGTEGDDVVAMTPSGWSSFDALGGNDTICLALGAAFTGPRDAVPLMGVLDAGAGDDVVVNEATLAPGASMSVGLGAGDDTFTGNADPADVFADSAVVVGLPPSPPVGTQRDQIDTGAGGGSVTSVAPPGGLNEDRITFGGGGARVVYIGAMGPQGLVDFTAAAPRPPLDFPCRAWSNRSEAASLSTTSVGGPRWAAPRCWPGAVSVNIFNFGQDGATSSRLPVSFAGSDASEDLTVLVGPMGDISLGGGDDFLRVQAYNDAYAPRSADGGPGSDTGMLETACKTLRVDVSRTAACNGVSGPFGGFRR